MENFTRLISDQLQVIYSKWRNLANEYSTGVAAGSAAIVGVTAGFPFDSIKTRVQILESPKSFGVVLRETIKTEGYRSLYRGVLAPLILASSLRILSFTTYEKVSRQLLNFNCSVSDSLNKEGSATYQSQLTAHNLSLIQKLPALMIAGAASGSITCLVKSPLDLMKIQLQLNSIHNYATSQRPKTLGVFNHKERFAGHACRIFKAYGLSGFYRGFTTHFIKDFLGSAVYFGCYEFLKHNLLTLNSKIKRNFEVSIPIQITSIIAGGLAGAVSWAAIYPLDLIKTRLQREAFYPLKDQKYGRSLVNCAKALYFESKTKFSSSKLPNLSGLKVFYRGLSPILLRALPIHSLTFLVYEQVRTWLEHP